MTVLSDEEIAAGLVGTNWRREGDYVQLIGPKTLRFRVPTN